jgi:hypothetical protein
MAGISDSPHSKAVMGQWRAAVRTSTWAIVLPASPRPELRTSSCRVTSRATGAPLRVAKVQVGTLSKGPSGLLPILVVARVRKCRPRLRHKLPVDVSAIARSGEARTSS